MKEAITICFNEWRYWSRTQLAVTVALLTLILVAISVFATFSQIAKEKNTRESLQVKAEQTFRSQPARHPHRMVHYGHYVFRTPTALAALDPGVDPLTGTVMFLEGHRQNSAAFSSQYDGAQAGAISRLSPAVAYQLLVPLVLIVIGFSVLSREREASTDRQLVSHGIAPSSIWLGKTLALGIVALLLLLPMLLGMLLTNVEWRMGFGFISLYFLYLAVWVLIITAVSTWSRSTSHALFILLASWLVLCILLPRFAVSTANTVIPNASQIETDMDLIVAMRSLSDGHNANDPTFEKLQANLLEQYKVESLEELPVNFRGVVAKTAEADLTAALNKYAEKRMAAQQAQTQWLKSYQFVSPFLALQSASMIAAGTDGRTHHRFLQEAEAVRFEFVQALNNIHEHELAYIDDINRSKDEESQRRTRVNADNWRLLNDFRFEADPAATRFQRLLSTYMVLLLWTVIFILAGVLGARRLPEVNGG